MIAKLLEDIFRFESVLQYCVTGVYPGKKLGSFAEFLHYLNRQNQPFTKFTSTKTDLVWLIYEKYFKNNRKIVYNFPHQILCLPITPNNATY